ANSADSYLWSMTSAAGQISSSGLITWNTSFDGVATISVTAFGCNGSQVMATKDIQVNSPPSVLAVNAPSVLCSGTTGLVQLSGSQSGVTYQLLGGGTPASATSWTVNAGTYTVRATRSSCPAVDFAPTTIGIQAPGVFQVQGGTSICENQNFQLTAINGHDFTWIIGDVRIDGISIDYHPDVSINQLTLSGTESSCQTAHSQTVAVSVVPQLNGVSIVNNIDFRCDGSGPTPMSLSSDGNLQSYSWSLSSNNSISPGAIDAHGIIEWSSSFTGTAVVLLTGNGCNGTFADTQEILVTPTPAHKVLTSASNLICSNATTQANLSNVGSREIYELFQVTTSGGTENVSLVGTASSPTWNLGPGTFYVRSTAPNCPTDITERLTINSIVHEVSLQTNVGTLIDQGNDYKLVACTDALVNLAVSEGS
ncbi:MAG TPA: hypothetical protein VJ508_12765, partial [Saprospiraceae bacterium]|nr:hypothetical protein [Saprospiraceae bacterium]